ncbi:MAG: hypothetical protein M3N08_02305 [Pseudomonadota bacterium]|nr:hypothetical protein [Pseudomonadota bacterium]
MVDQTTSAQVSAETLDVYTKSDFKDIPAALDLIGTASLQSHGVKMVGTKPDLIDQKSREAVFQLIDEQIKKQNAIMAAEKRSGWNPLGWGGKEDDAFDAASANVKSLNRAKDQLNKFGQEITGAVVAGGNNWNTAEKVHDTTLKIVGTDNYKDLKESLGLVSPDLITKNQVGLVHGIPDLTDPNNRAHFIAAASQQMDRENSIMAAEKRGGYNPARWFAGEDSAYDKAKVAHDKLLHAVSLVNNYGEEIGAAMAEPAAAVAQHNSAQHNSTQHNSTQHNRKSAPTGGAHRAMHAAAVAGAGAGAGASVAHTSHRDNNHVLTDALIHDGDLQTFLHNQQKDGKAYLEGPATADATRRALQAYLVDNGYYDAQKNSARHPNVDGQAATRESEVDGLFEGRSRTAINKWLGREADGDKFSAATITAMHDKVKATSVTPAAEKPAEKSESAPTELTAEQKAARAQAEATIAAAASAAAFDKAATAIGADAHIDVKNDAIRADMQKHWNGIKAGELPENMQVPALKLAMKLNDDEKAMKIIADANGNPDAVLAALNTPSGPASPNRNSLKALSSAVPDKSLAAFAAHQDAKGNPTGIGGQKLDLKLDPEFANHLTQGLNQLNQTQEGKFAITDGKHSHGLFGLKHDGVAKDDPRRNGTGVVVGYNGDPSDAAGLEAFKKDLYAVAAKSGLVVTPPSKDGPANQFLLSEAPPAQTPSSRLTASGASGGRYGRGDYRGDYEGSAADLGVYIAGQNILSFGNGFGASWGNWGVGAYGNNRNVVINNFGERGSHGEHGGHGGDHDRDGRGRDGHERDGHRHDGGQGFGGDRGNHGGDHGHPVQPIHFEPPTHLHNGMHSFSGQSSAAVTAAHGQHIVQPRAGARSGGGASFRGGGGAAFRGGAAPHGGSPHR